MNSKSIYGWTPLWNLQMYALQYLTAERYGAVEMGSFKGLGPQNMFKAQANSIQLYQDSSPDT